MATSRRLLLGQADRLQRRGFRHDRRRHAQRHPDLDRHLLSRQALDLQSPGDPHPDDRRARFLDAAPSFLLKSGGSWKNSQPIHALSGCAPFAIVGAGYNANSLSFWSDAYSLTMTMATESTEYMAYTKFGRRYSNLHVDEILHASGRVALSALANYANDAAAATGGVAVGDCYRNGSVVRCGCLSQRAWNGDRPQRRFPFGRGDNPIGSGVRREFAERRA